MAFQSILVHVDDGPSSAARIRSAVDIARRFGSRMVAMIASPTPQVSVDIRQLAPADIAKLTQARETREANRALLQSCAAQAGLGQVEMRVLTGELIDAEQALRLGIVSAVHPPERLLAATYELAAKIAAGPPIAIRLARRALYRNLQEDLQSALEFETFAQNICADTDDAREGIRAFVEKREPTFAGR